MYVRARQISTRTWLFLHLSFHSGRYGFTPCCLLLLILRWFLLIRVVCFALGRLDQHTVEFLDTLAFLLLEHLLLGFHLDFKLSLIRVILLFRTGLIFPDSGFHMFRKERESGGQGSIPFDMLIEQQHVPRSSAQMLLVHLLVFYTLPRELKQPSLVFQESWQCSRCFRLPSSSHHPRV